MTDVHVEREAPPGRCRRRRRLRAVIAMVVLACMVVAGGMIGAGLWVRSRVESTVALRIDQQLPGSRSSVSISSFPFLVQLAASGTVEEMSAHLSRVSAGPFTYNGIHIEAVAFNDVNIHIDDLHMSRHQLLHRKVVIDRIRAATVTATLDQGSLDRSVGLPITLGDGTVGIGGLSLPAGISIDSRRITVTVPNQFSFSLTPPPLAVLPCIGQVRIVPGALQLSCTLNRLPPVLAGSTFSF